MKRYSYLYVVWSGPLLSEILNCKLTDLSLRKFELQSANVGSRNNVFKNLVGEHLYMKV